MAKSIANGFPMGAVVTTAEVAKSLTGALHMNTYGGNPIGCAAAIAVLDVIEEEKLQERSHTLGGYFLQKLLELRDEFQIIGDVRGTGLMLGVELVEDRETRKPLPAEKVNKLWEDTKDLGILVGKGGLYGSVFRIKPPMCITEDDIDFAIAVLRKTLQQL
jgi:alanine-glyoxylate transaminase/(R)-3-amino-2-methylpropionate-pyruvate transaminase